jgi:uncharacterized membrane protein YgcG
MARILIWGDSQAGTPGNAAKRELVAAGHTVTLVHNDSKSPVVQSREPYWSQYQAAARNADVILLIFGHNSLATPATETALRKFKQDVRPPVLMSGPPRYRTAEDHREGDALREMNGRIFGARYIDAYPSTGLELPRVSPTNPHFTPTGAAPWGHAMAQAVLAFLAGSSSPPAPHGGGGGGGGGGNGGSRSGGGGGSSLDPR